MEQREFMSETVHVRKCKKVNRLLCCLNHSVISIGRTAVWCKLFASALKGKIMIAFRSEESRDTVVTQPFLFVIFPC